MQEWFEADAADGFWISPNLEEGGIDDFVDGVVPILQDRGLFHRDYAGTPSATTSAHRHNTGSIRASPSDPPTTLPRTPSSTSTSMTTDDAYEENQ